MNRFVRGMGATAAALLAGCGALVGDQATVGGETHFLVTCEQGCGDGLSCIDGVCTRGCEPGLSSCSELSDSAVCASAADAVQSLGFRGTCDVPCSSDGDCAAIGDEHTCRSGVCRAPATAALASPTGSARAPLVHAVDANTCKSGLRWVGGDSHSPEMRPGSDCLACHGDGSARPFLAAGTVYPFAIGPGNDPTPDDPFDRQPLDDCLGIEGVEVGIVDAVGRELSTTTNRAGNFYFEAPSELTMPYTATIRWPAGDAVISPQMLVTPMYGGCGRCHGTSSPASGPFDPAPMDPAYILPVAAIFTPGLYRNDSQ